MHAVDLTGMTVEAVKEFGLSRKDAARAKNMFALGLVSWMYGRPTETTVTFLERRFAKVPDIRDANIAAFHAGWNFGETTEAFVVQYEIKPAPMRAGTYRNITGNLALSYGLVAGAVQSDLPLFLGSYPITPASDILHELSKHKRFGVTTFQAEDEIAGVGAALGAAFAGALGVTTTSGPGPRAEVGDHRARRDDRAAAGRRRRPARRPLDRAAHQDRAGRPAAGDVRPQRRVAGADRGAAVARRLLRRRRRGDPDRGHLPHPGDAALRRHAGQRLRAVGRPGRRRAARHRPALRHRAEPRRDRPRRARTSRSSGPTCATRRPSPARGPSPAPPGLEHRIGGLEKGDGHGNISYDPANHDLMVRTRQAKVDRIAESLPPLEVDDPSGPRRGRQGARGRVGLDVRPDRRGLPPRPQRRRPRRPAAPAPPQPVPEGPRRDPRALRRRAGARDEPRPAVAAAARPVPRRRRRLQPGQRHAHQGRRARRGRDRASSSPPTPPSSPSTPSSERTPDDAEPIDLPFPGLTGVPTTDEPAEPQGVHLRPGGPLVPRLRRLRRAGRGAGVPADARPAPREHRLRLRHRLLQPLPVLPRHLRHALDPRPRAGDRDRPRHRPRGPLGLGGHR